MPGGLPGRMANAGRKFIFLSVYFSVRHFSIFSSSPTPGPLRLPSETKIKLDRKLGNRQTRFMKTTIDLPADLIKEIKLLAVDEGKKFNDVFADLLRQGLKAASVGVGNVVKADKATLKRRKALTKKFIAGKWGLELSGFEAVRAADCRSSAEQARAWRD
jgi:hypothetical protein